MTAVPSSSDRRPLLVRALAVVLSAAVAWTPWAVTWADPISNAAAAGQAAGAAARGALALPSQSGNAIVMPGGTGGDLSFTTLFPGSAGGDPATFSQWYGNDNAVAGNGRNAQANLMTEQSPSGAAYRTVRGAVDRSRPDRRNDPLWSQTDDVLDHFDELASTFADCSTVTTFKEGTRKTHVPDLRTCEVVAKGGNCSWFHDYSLPTGFTMLTANGGAVREDCGPGCERITYAHGGQFAIGQKNVFPTPYAAQVFGFTVAEPARVNTVTVTLAAGAPENSGVLGDIDRLTLQYAAAFPGYAFASSDNSGQAWGGIARPALSGQDFTEALRNGGNFTILNNYQKRYKSKIWANGSWDYSVSVTVLYTPKHQPVTDWGWTTNESCRVLYNQVVAGGCGGSVQCLGAPALAANGCYQDTGVQVCPGDLEQPPVAVSPFCREVRVTSDCSTINRGPMDCWTDAHGQVQCPNNDGGYDNCKELEDNPNCGFLREACLEGAERDGVCFVKEQTWDCGTLHSIPVLKREQSIECAGPVRCMGTDCVDPDSEQSADFAKAVAALEAAQMMATDMQCDPGGNCVVFNGERNECKRAVGGIVNCCKTPEGVSLGNYLTLVFSLAKLDSAIMGMNKGGAIRGSWEALRQPLTSTWSAVKESFSSVANSLTGATSRSGDRCGRARCSRSGQAGGAQQDGDLGGADVRGRGGECAVLGSQWRRRNQQWYRFVSPATRRRSGMAGQRHGLGHVRLHDLHRGDDPHQDHLDLREEGIRAGCETGTQGLPQRRRLLQIEGAGLVHREARHLLLLQYAARAHSERTDPAAARPGLGKPQESGLQGHQRAGLLACRLEPRQSGRVAGDPLRDGPLPHGGDDQPGASDRHWQRALRRRGPGELGRAVRRPHHRPRCRTDPQGCRRGAVVGRVAESSVICPWRAIEMAKLYRTVGMAVLSVALVGCASAPKVYESTFQENPRYSRAMNVLMAAGYVDDPAKSPIRDAPQAKVAQAAKSGGLGGLDVAYAVSSALAPPPGIGFGFGLGMGVVSLLAPSPVEPLSRSMVIAWMPRSEASDPNQATAKLQAQLKQALEEAIRERLPAPFTVGPPIPKHPARFAIAGGPCNEKGHQCVLQAAVHSASQRQAWRQGCSGGGSAWTWHPIGRPSEVMAATFWPSVTVSGDWTKPHRDWLPDLAIYQDWSKRLPEWVFIYLAPTTPISLGNGQGFLKFPVVLNKGEALYFVSPGA